MVYSFVDDICGMISSVVTGDMLCSMITGRNGKI